MLPIASHALADHVVISEVLVDASGSEAAFEFVELYNPTGDTVAIGGWDVAYKTASGSSFSAVATIPSGREIGPYRCFLIGGDQVSPTPDHVDTSLGFAATGGHVALRTSSNAIVDKIGYGGANDPEGTAKPAPAVDQTLERKPGASDPTKGNGQDSEDNATDFDTRVSAQAQNAASGAEIPDFVAGTVAVAASELKGLTATSNVTVTDADRNNRSGVAETVSVKVTSLADPTGITLTVQETASSASTFDLSTAGGPLGLTLGASSVATRKIKIRASGDTITITYTDPAPFGAATATIRFLGLGRVALNEAVFNPTGTDQGKEWVELYNVDTISVDLSGWTLTNEDAGTVMEMPSGVVIPSGSFLEWRVDTSGVSDTDFSDGRGTVFSGEATTVTLTNTNDQISLYASTTRDKNTIVDFVQYSTTGVISETTDAQNAVDVGLWPSTDTFVNAAPAPEGASLRLLPDGTDNNRPSDWSIDSSPSPGQTNAFFIAPTAPTNLDAVAGVEVADVTWMASTAGTDPILGYRLFRGTSTIALAQIAFRTTATYHDTGVTPSTTYYYAARAEDVNGALGDTSNIDSATPNPYAPPGAPTNLIAAGNPFRNDLSWDTASLGSYKLSKYRIFRSIVSGSYGESLAEVSSTKTTYTDSNVTVGQQYFYSVRAVDTAGIAGNTSAQATVVTQGYAPAPPPGTTLVINEIMYDPVGSEPANEWVEIANPTDTPIAIGGLIFEDNSASFTIPSGNTVPAQGYFVLGYSASAAGGQVDVVYGSTAGNLSLANTGDTVTLRTDTALIDRVAYLGSWGGGETASLSRKFSGAMSQNQTSWGKSIHTGGTPRAANYVDTLPPLFTHTPASRAAAGRDVGIHAVVSDNIEKELELGDVSLFYRSQGDSNYSEIVMNRVAITDWNAVIPGAGVETPALEYYIVGIDASNNIGGYATSETPQSVNVVVIDTKVAINEIMYDPTENEPDNEWVEIRNYGSSSENISGWRFGDGEDFFIIPQGTTVPSGGYLVFEKTEGATPVTGSGRLVYGDSAPAIQFFNIIGEITDQVVLQDPSGLVVDEVNYSAEQGAQNLSVDPKNTTLERFDPSKGSNDRTNWLYSYQVGGTPGGANGFKFIRNFDMSKTLIDPTAGDSVLFTFDLIVDTTTFVKLEIFNESGQIRRTIHLDTAQESGVYSRSFSWDGKDTAGQPILGILTVDPVATNVRGEVCRQMIDDKTALLPASDIISGGRYRASTRTYFGYTLTKPMLVTFLFRKLESGFNGPNTRFIWRDVPAPSGRIYAPWDGRDDTGIIVSYGPLPLISARPILGNVLISRKPMRLMGVEFAPRTSFNPISETQYVRFDLTDTARVTIRVRRPSDGMLMRAVTTDQVRPYGFNEVGWDGRNEATAIVDDGLYIMEVHAESPVGREQATEFGEVYVRRGF